MNFILASIGVFLVTILLLVVILLVAKKYLSPSGNVNITINGDKTISVAQGGSVLSTLASEGIRPVQRSKLVIRIWSIFS
jgi:Na+-transporting NADH:ubiquinone oxidoreductase subunit F